MSSWRFEVGSLGRTLVAPAPHPGAFLAYTTLGFRGLLSGDGAERVRRFVVDATGAEVSLASCSQVHGNTVQRVGGARSSWLETSSCDALWTSEPGVCLAIKVADCLPVTLFDREGGFLGNAHAGWRGCARGVVSETIDSMSAAGFSAARAVVFLGPSIRACCFEVGEEVVEALAESRGSIERHVNRSTGRAHVDLPALTRDDLIRAGVHPESIEDCGLCTRCGDPVFHSWRRDRAASGRNLALAAQ